jgi:hypothetical protein
MRALQRRVARLAGGVPAFRAVALAALGGIYPGIDSGPYCSAATVHSRTMLSGCVEKD